MPAARSTFQVKLTRSKFEQMTEDLLERCVGPFERALSDAGVSAKQIDEVVLVGGSTRMPMVQEIGFGRSREARSRIGASTPTKWWRSARRSRLASWRAR